MIKELNPIHGFEVWLNKHLEKTIEDAVRKELNTDTINYYHLECQCDKKSSDDIDPSMKFVWHGSCGIKEFFKKAQKVNTHFVVLGATNARNKSELDIYLHGNNGEHFHSGYTAKDGKLIYDYWFGDVKFNEMICGGELVIKYWDRIRDKVTKGATTYKIY